MATLTFGASLDGFYPTDSLKGGTITARSASSMTYISDLGYTVTLQGTGLVYDADGMPSGGTLTRTTIAKDGTTYADYAGFSVDFARAGMLLFGYDMNGTRHQNPDTWTFINLLLRYDDLMIGSSGHYEFAGSHGNDTIQAGAGDDHVGGEGGNDVMDGGEGWDTLYYGDANYSWESYRGLQLDALSGIVTDCWGGQDTISNFEHFVDSLYSDTLKGADIDENFVLNRGNDVVNGRGGFDWVRYYDVDRWGAHRGVNVNLATGIARDSWKGTDTLSNVEGVEGSAFDDTLKGNAAHNAFAGGKGVDLIDGAGGIDELGFWNLGWDGTGHGVIVDLTAAMNVIDDGYGNSETATRIENVTGSQFADRITGNQLDSHFWGADGNDTLIGGAGNDDLAGEWGNDSVDGGSGNDSIDGDGDDDILIGGGGVDQFSFGWDLVDMGIDRITDFAAGETIWVGAWWGGGLVNQDLVASQFRSGAGVTTANSASQRFLYNTTTGDLYFDADGNGSKATAVRFATLSNHFALSFGDIHILL